MNIDGYITILYVYWLGILYSLIELWNDYWKKIKGELEESFILEKIKSKKFINESKEKLAIITGGDGNIGVEVVKILIKLDYKVIIIGLHNQFNDENVKYYCCDLFMREEVVKVINLIKNDYSKDSIDLMICNAAVMLSPYKLSTNNNESHLEVNLLSHILLINELKPKLTNKSRILFISSVTCKASQISNESIYKNDDNLWINYINGYQSYSNSKFLINVFVEQYFYENNDKIIISAHPGIVPGKLYRHTNFLFKFFINNILFKFVRTNKIAALRLAELIFDDNLKSGSYYEDGIVQDFMDKMADIKTRTRLYKMMMRRLNY